METKEWRPFRLLSLPLDWDNDHTRSCMACQKAIHRSAIAYHEATHLAVATNLGLAVEFCSIDDSQMVPASRLEALLYGGLIQEGMLIPAQVTRLRPDMFHLAPKRTLVALVAPSCVVTGDPGIDLYSRLEAEIGAHWARSLGEDPAEIFDWAKREVEAAEEDILRYARRLGHEGRFEVGNDCAL